MAGLFSECALFLSVSFGLSFKFLLSKPSNLFASITYYMYGIQLKSSLIIPKYLDLSTCWSTQLHKKPFQWLSISIYSHHLTFLRVEFHSQYICPFHEFVLVLFGSQSAKRWLVFLVVDVLIMQGHRDTYTAHDLNKLPPELALANVATCDIRDIIMFF